MRAIVIHGKGRHFSSGVDVHTLIDSIFRETVLDKSNEIIDYPPFLHDNVESFTKLLELNIPVVAAIRGVCLGSALELALFSHVRVCSAGAVLGLPESTFNLLPGCGGIQRMTEICGIAKSMELILTGRTFSADEALSLNVVDVVVPNKEVIEFSMRIAREISSDFELCKKENAVRVIKKLKDE